MLDASALLALLQDEPGADAIASRLAHAVMCTVNHSEVVAKLADAGMPEDAVREALSLPIRLVDFDAALSVHAGMLRQVTRALGLSFGDRACLALAAARGLTAVTTEAAWADVPGGPEVEIIRPPPRSRGRPAGKRTSR
ncbi:MAG: PIN domain-containing protein [Sandaracinaceae bacterium]|nr:PIN domain-containing protein [Sandaracinaceae bacterium]